MDITSIRLLGSLVEGDKKTGELASLLGVKGRRLAYMIKKLSEGDYIDKENATVRLKGTPKAILFRDVTQLVDVERLLRGSNETVLSAMDKSITVDQLTKKSGLSKATVYRSISDLRSIGAIRKNDGAVSIDGSKEPLLLFAKLLKIEREKKYEDGSTQIIYNDRSVILRKTRSGKAAKGITTGFTLFPDYGVEYNTTHDYFCEQKENLEIQDILLHAVYSAIHSKSKMELLMSVIFYIKHKDRMDIQRLRKKSSDLGISEVWLDIEAYVGRQPLKNPDLFLPWNEFVPKAELYDLPPEKYTLPKPSNLLFHEIGARLHRPKTVYLFGGENMRIKSLKDSTKDCDIVVESREDFDDLAQALAGTGYKRRPETSYSDEDMRISPSDIFEHDQKGRIDLFASTIMHDLSLSGPMKEKADIRNYGKLKVGLLRDEDVFLLKAVASREGDIQDMAALVAGSPNTPAELRHGSFDWDSVWDEILRQERINRTRYFTAVIFEQIAYLAEQTGTVAPFLGKLRRHVIDMMIKRMLRGGSMPIREIVGFLVGGDITEPMIRNRIDSLEKSKVAGKHSVGRTTHVILLKDNEYPEGGLGISMHRLKTYLDWRFFLRERQSDLIIGELAEELGGLGFATIGGIDEMVRNSAEILTQYENEQFSARHFDTVEATRICIGLHYPELGNRRSSKYFVRQFGKYNGLARAKFVPGRPIRAAET